MTAGGCRRGLTRPPLGHPCSAAPPPPPAPAETKAKIRERTFAAMQRPEVRERLKAANEHRVPHSDSTKVGGAGCPISNCGRRCAVYCFMLVACGCRPRAVTRACLPCDVLQSARPATNLTRGCCCLCACCPQEKIRVSLQARAAKTRAIIAEQAELIVVKMAASEDAETAAAGAHPKAAAVVAGLAWQYFKRDWESVRCSAGRGAEGTGGSV